MRVLVAPDRFAGSLTAAQAGAAMAAGWARVAAYDALEVLPLSDGGPGFLDVLQAALGGKPAAVTVTGPLGGAVPARILSVDGTAYIEAAEAVGLHLTACQGHAGEPADCAAQTPCAERASSRGVGELLAAAVATGARRVVVGVGGTATTEGGRGLVAALGDLAAGRERLAGVEVVAATATDAPLMGHSGAAHGFAAGKGADRATRDRLEERLRNWATETDGKLAVHPGAGAGGGIGFGLLLLGARRVNGTELVAAAVGLDDRVASADLALTGLGVFDWESMRGRVPAAVARAAQRAGRPTVLLADRVEVGRRELGNAGIDAAYAVADLLGEGPRGGERLAGAAARVARTWSHEASR